MIDIPSQSTILSKFPCGMCRNIPEEGQRFDSMLHCRQCWLFHTHQQFNLMWGGDGNIGNNKRTMALATCQHLGRANGKFVDCATCGGKKTRLKLFECKIHGACLPSSISDSVHSCIGCTDRHSKPAEYWTGFHDPLPAPPVDPRPFQWPTAPEVIHTHQIALGSVLEALLTTPEGSLPFKSEGRGIVFCGGGKYWPGIVVACTLIRRMGCSLPIQIWYRGKEEKVDKEDIKDLEGITLVDSTLIEPKPRIMGGWEIKTLALLHCGWEEVLYLDADAYPVSDPTTLFDFLGDRKYRFAFWSDFPHHKDSIKWDKYGLKEGDIPPIQGGQLYINRRMFWKELLLAHWINQHSDYFYHHQYGDQDSWRVALALTGGTYAHLGPADYHKIGDTHSQSVFICGIGRGEDRQDVIVHRCQAKLFHPWDRGDGKAPPFDYDIPKEYEVVDIFNGLRIGSRAVFKEVYESGTWGPNTISGSGSLAEEAKPYLELINGYIHILGDSKDVVDLGCGDGRIISKIRAQGQVVGVDVYSPHLSRLFVEHPKIQWVCADIFDQIGKLPEGGICLIKDVFHHWPNHMIEEWLMSAIQIKKWKHIFITVDVENVKEGQDCPLGGYRPLNESYTPFKMLYITRVASYFHKGIFYLQTGK